MKSGLKILIVGTADTKSDELLFMKECIEREGASGVIMDVGVLGTPVFDPEISNVKVAAAAGITLKEIAALGDENAAMTKMAEGAVKLTLDLYAKGQVHGVLALGGTMGTDLALDVTAALPLGMPKFIVTTVAYSHLIPPDRLAADVMMILWAGGLYGLNSICRATLSQAAGAVLGACSTVTLSKAARPRVAIGGLGKSCLSYMVELTPQLEKRGYEPVVFHCTGMGGRAMESLIEQGTFVAVFDLALCELSNILRGSVVNAGASRLETAGRLGVPQIIAPGASDMVDVQTWAPLPERYRGRPYHAHNRLIASVTTTSEERRELARFVASKVNAAKGPTAFLLPLQGIHAWDAPGQPLHDPQGHQVFIDEYKQLIEPPVDLRVLDMHINDRAFTDEALGIFDNWVEAGLIPPGVTEQ
ncbi:Tm-1-like ATP-binding domain-containing protein [Trinickia diaoshuihuensis]|uniref:Tm-1-like ATP-binding domain-containing protein n=1 Tax=Trinickia diaoshuihuensis TaxID=2292265 RepID=UPI000E278B69|nr:Tm-1-like ATP-binding domain-containing protein [Trinickia diaoshuihuensis]